jgi:hypothetical protein
MPRCPSVQKGFLSFHLVEQHSIASFADVDLSGQDSGLG